MRIIKYNLIYSSVFNFSEDQQQTLVISTIIIHCCQLENFSMKEAPSYPIVLNLGYSLKMDIIVRILLNHQETKYHLFVIYIVDFISISRRIVDRLLEFWKIFFHLDF